MIERRIRTEPERFAAVLGIRARARVLIEASTDSEWVARCLERSYATRTRKAKPDRRDAPALAEACRLGA